MTSRGAWPASGLGGTLSIDGAHPGPYYVLAKSGPKVGGLGNFSSPDVNIRAVRGAVRAIQNMLRRAGYDIAVTGVFDKDTSDATIAFQKVHPETGGADGAIGPKTAAQLVKLDLIKHSDYRKVTAGIFKAESNFDPGCVGVIDPTDLGLAQINGKAHPDISEKERLKPLVAIDFVNGYLANSLAEFDYHWNPAIASYNLGIGGARRWVMEGMPDMYSPAGDGKFRHMGGRNCQHEEKNGYIDKIRTFGRSFFS